MPELPISSLEDILPPVPKYTLDVTITANSKEELLDRVHGLDVNSGYYLERDELESTDGTTSIKLTHTKPDQTPEAYKAELMEWARARRAIRRAGE